MWKDSCSKVVTEKSNNRFLSLWRLTQSDSVKSSCLDADRQKQQRRPNLHLHKILSCLNFSGESSRFSVLKLQWDDGGEPWSLCRTTSFLVSGWPMKSRAASHGSNLRGEWRSGDDCFCQQRALLISRPQLSCCSVSLQVLNREGFQLSLQLCGSVPVKHE